jgi:hypothetical protein
VDAQLSPDEVLNQIQQLNQNGITLNKKKVKQSHPELMKSALYYYPSWQHAIDESGVG